MINFLQSRKKFIFFLTTNILHKVFLILQVQVIVELVFVQIHISDEAFLVLIVTFLEKFYVLYSLISCLSGFHTELHQNMYFSLVTVLVCVYCFCLVVEVFHQFFLCFSEMLLG